LRLGRTDEAAEAARAGRRAVPDDMRNLYFQARVLARAAALTPQAGPESEAGGLRERYAREAMDCLREAVDCGLDSRLDLDGGDFASLRPRDDFKKLRAQLESTSK